MNWEAMTPEEKNELVYSKVMGQSLEVQCTAVEDDINAIRRPEDHYQNLGWWICDVCGYIGQGDDYSHLRLLKIPPYTQSMDAAWQVVRKVNGSGPGYDTYTRFIDALEKIVGSDMFYDLFYCDQYSDHLTPERICKAALQAKGIDVN